MEHGRMSELEGKGKSVSEALQSYKAKAQVFQAIKGNSTGNKESLLRRVAQVCA